MDLNLENLGEIQFSYPCSSQCWSANSMEAYLTNGFGRGKKGEWTS